MSEADLILIISLGLTGLVSGWLNVMAGGGSLLTLPVMLFMDIPAPVANGTNRIGIIFQNISAVIGFFVQGFSNFKLSLTLSVCASIGAIGGAMVGTKLDGRLFNNFLIVVMVVVMLMTAFGQKKLKNKNGKAKNIALGHILMVGAGAWGGLIQVGVGFILMPILNVVMGLDLVKTNMHKVFIALSYSLFAVTIFATEVGILWHAGLALAIGTAIGGFFGSRTSVKKGEKWIRYTLYCVLTVFIIKLITTDS